MNSVNLIGRLTSDPESYSTPSGTPVAKFSLAVRRDENTTDFIPIVAFGKSADFCTKWLKKGMQIGVEGSLQTGKYKNNDGKTVYSWNVNAAKFDFAESKKEERPF